MIASLLRQTVEAQIAPAARRARSRVVGALIAALFAVALAANLYAAAFFLLAPLLPLAQVFLVLAAISLVPVLVVGLLQRRRSRRRDAQRSAASDALRLGLAFEAARAASRNWPLLLLGAAALVFTARAGRDEA